MEEENPSPTFRLNPALERAQIERLREVKASRNQTEVVESLSRLEQTARGDGNLLPLILDAAGAYATVGEISDRLRAVFGEYRTTA
jgi:methylmalonyl-CoA mutase N-terminal domain/subunit